MAEAQLEVEPKSPEPTPAPEGKKPKLHLNWLDGMRGIAALYVIFHHIAWQLPHPNNGLLAKLFWNSFMDGHRAVDTFIVLSGFCLMIPVSRAGGVLNGGVGRFFKRRAIRILPTYYAAMAVSLLLIFTIIGDKTSTWWDHSLPVGWKDVLVHVLLIQDLFQGMNSTINHVFWSISVEWHIYFLFPILIIAARRFGIVWSTIATVALSYLVYILLYCFTNVNTGYSGSSPFYVGLFALGMLACDLTMGKLKDRPINPQLVSVITVLCLFVAYGTQHIHVLGTYVPWQLAVLLSGIGSAGIMLLLGRGHWPWLKTFFSSKIPVWLGIFGYSLYLFHAPMIQVLWLYVVKPLNLSPAHQMLALAALSPLIVAFCYGCYLLFERPIVRKLAAK